MQVGVRHMCMSDSYTERRNACADAGHHGPYTVETAKAMETGGQVLVEITAICEHCEYRWDVEPLVPVGPMPKVNNYDDYVIGVDHDSVRYDGSGWEATVSVHLLTDTGDGPKNMREEVKTVEFYSP